MADELSQLLLSDSDSVVLKPPPTPPPLQRSLDSRIELSIGSFSCAQLLQVALVSFASVFDAQQTFITVFTDAEPKWHCNVDGRFNSLCDSSLASVCTLPLNAWSWDLSPAVSIISEWGLQCAGSLVKGLPSSSFFFGCLIGGLILPTLADSSLGRKNMLLLSCLVMALSSMLTFFSTNIWIYAFLRFVSGFGRSTIGTCTLVLSMEVVGRKWRGQVGVMGFFCFTLGFMSLPLMGYLNEGHSWRLLYLWTSIPTIIYCLLVRSFVHESPRWLLVKGRKEEAVSILQSIATPTDNNGGLITTSFLSLPLEQEEGSNVDLYGAMMMLVQKRWCLRRIMAVMAVGFGIGVVYYGMPLALSDLNFNIYLAVTFNALSELPASLVTFLFIDRLSRRNALIGFTALSGIASCLIAVLDHFKLSQGTLQVALELVSFFSACSANNLELIYTIELFPTCVRNSAIAMLRQALVLGGVFCPVMVAAGRSNQFWSYGLFGLAIGLFGLFVVGLPETRGSVLTDTMEEEENKERQWDFHPHKSSVLDLP